MSLVQAKTLVIDNPQGCAGSDGASPFKKWKVYGLAIAKLMISCGLIYWIIQRANVVEIMGSLQQANMPLLLGAFCMNFIGYVLSVNRWHMLLKVQGVLISRFYLLQSFMVAFFFNNLLPSTFGGDAIRAYDCWKIGGSKVKAVVTVFADRFLGLVALTLLVWSGITLSWESTKELPLFPLWIIGSTVGAVGVCWLVFSPVNKSSRSLSFSDSHIWWKPLRVVQKVCDTFRIFKDQKKVLGKALGISVALQINVIVYYYLVAQSLHFQIPLHSFFFFIPVVLFMMMIPVTINGIGIRENAFAYFLSMFGVSTSEALAFSWLTYGFILLQGVLGGIVYILRR